MAAKIIDVCKVSDTTVKVYYESGKTRRMEIDNLSKTVLAWVEDAGMDLLKPEPTSEELAEQAWLDATEPEDIARATVELMTADPEVAIEVQGKESEIWADINMDGQEEQTESIPAPAEETITAIAIAPIEEEAVEAEEITETAITVIETEEAAEESAIIEEEAQEEGTDIIDVAVAVATAVVQGVQIVAPVLQQAAKAVAATAPVVGMWVIDQLSAFWFVLSTYLPLWIEKMATIAVWIVFPKARKLTRKAVRVLGASAAVVGRGAMAAALLGAAGATWMIKVTIRTVLQMAQLIANGWNLRAEILEEQKMGAA